MRLFALIFGSQTTLLQPHITLGCVFLDLYKCSFWIFIIKMRPLHYLTWFNFLLTYREHVFQYVCVDLLFYIVQCCNIPVYRWQPAELSPFMKGCLPVMVPSCWEATASLWPCQVLAAGTCRAFPQLGWHFLPSVSASASLLQQGRPCWMQRTPFSIPHHPLPEELVFFVSIILIITRNHIIWSIDYFP